MTNQIDRRRLITSSSALLAAGLIPTLPTRLAAQSTLPPPLPTSITTLLSTQIIQVIQGLRSQTPLLPSLVSRLTGSLETTLLLWQANGTIPYLQALSTPTTLAQFQFGPETEISLAAQAATLQVPASPLDLVIIQNQFPVIQPQMTPDVQAGMMHMISSLGKMTGSAGSGGGIGTEPSAYSGFSDFPPRPQIRLAQFHPSPSPAPAPSYSGSDPNIYPLGICWYALDAAVCGFFAALAWEVPPISALLAALGFVYAVAAVLMC